MSPGSKASRIERYVHHSGEKLEIPVGRIVGDRPGPRFSVSAGMHAGEPAGMNAAIRLWRDIDPAQLSGQLLIIPLMSTRAFFSRNMQLSPIDQKELHFQLVGNPEGTYSEFQIDCVFNLLRDSNYHVDMHGAEHAQALDPWVAFFEPQDPRQSEEAWMLASSFPVRYLDPRNRDNMADGLPYALLQAGVVNVWPEIGLDHRLEREASDMQYQGVINAMRKLRMLDGEPEEVPEQIVVGPDRWMVLAENSGYWRRFVEPGERVSKGQSLGEIRDLEGEVIEEVTAPADGLIQFLATSPGINVDRVPHGYPWHQGLARLVQVREDRRPPTPRAG